MGEIRSDFVENIFHMIELPDAGQSTIAPQTKLQEIRKTYGMPYVGAQPVTLMFRLSDGKKGSKPFYARYLGLPNIINTHGVWAKLLDADCCNFFDYAPIKPPKAEQLIFEIAIVPPQDENGQPISVTPSSDVRVAAAAQNRQRENMMGESGVFDRIDIITPALYASWHDHTLPFETRKERRIKSFLPKNPNTGPS